MARSAHFDAHPFASPAQHGHQGIEREFADLVMWDNRSTMHYAANDYGSVDRRMRRITLRGDRPVGPTGFTSHVADDPLVAVR